MIEAKSMSTSNEVAVMRLALEALEAMMNEFKGYDLPYGSSAYKIAKDACLDLYQVITEAEKQMSVSVGEPVALIYEQSRHLMITFLPEAEKLKHGDKLYTELQPKTPLTHEQVDELARTMVKGNKSVNWLARAIEAAHGICPSDFKE